MRSIRLGLVFAGVLWISACGQGALTGDEGSVDEELSSATIYGDALKNGWTNASTATVNFRNGRPVHGGSRSMSVTFTDPSQALSLANDGFSTKGVSQLSMYVNGGTGDATQLILGVRTGTTWHLAALSSFCKVTAHAWVRCVAPLSALGALNTSVTGVGIGSAVAGRIDIDTLAFGGPPSSGSPGPIDAGVTAPPPDAGSTTTPPPPPPPDAGTHTPDAGTVSPVGGNGTAPSVRVVGNHLVDANGKVLQLHGTNRSGAEYACAEGWGIFDGPTDDDTSIDAIQTWNINAIRLPMNEDCWLGINGVDAQYSGTAYQNAIVAYANRLNAHGLVVILNLHFSAAGTKLPDDQSPMPDRDHSNAFWTGVASVFKNNHSVLFDLFNEPYPDDNNDTTAAWSCVLNGGTCPGLSYQAAGMQEMANAVRATGATQPLLIAGPQYAGVVDQWQKYKPTDPLNQLVASIHIYGLPLDSPCREESCWNSQMAPLATTTPIVIGELGDTDCTTKFSPPLMTWADAHGIGYTPWAWNTGNCAGDPSLITNYNGTPTAFGLGVKNHLLSLPAW